MPLEPPRGLFQRQAASLSSVGLVWLRTPCPVPFSEKRQILAHILYRNYILYVTYVNHVSIHIFFSSFSLVVSASCLAVSLRFRFVLVRLFVRHTESVNHTVENEWNSTTLVTCGIGAIRRAQNQLSHTYTYS